MGLELIDSNPNNIINAGGDVSGELTRADRYLLPIDYIPTFDEDVVPENPVEELGNLPQIRAALMQLVRGGAYDDSSDDSSGDSSDDSSDEHGTPDIMLEMFQQLLSGSGIRVMAMRGPPANRLMGYSLDDLRLRLEEALVLGEADRVDTILAEITRRESQ